MSLIVYGIRRMKVGWGGMQSTSAAHSSFLDSHVCFKVVLNSIILTGWINIMAFFFTITLCMLSTIQTFVLEAEIWCC